MRPPVDDASPESAQGRPSPWLRRLIWITLLAGILAFLVEGADNPDDPWLVPEEAGDQVATGPAQVPEAAEEPARPQAAVTTTSSPVTSLAPVVPTTRAPARPGSPPPPPPAPAAATSAPPRPLPDAPTRRPLPGFEEVTFRITGPGGAVTDGVAMLADDGASRGQGLMEQTDLRGYDAMVFRFPSPSNGGFYMRNTRIPLSIAFFDADGRFISSADMPPCPDEVEDCPTYSADRPYLHAIEVAQGGLPALGIRPGSTLSFP